MAVHLVRVQRGEDLSWGTLRGDSVAVLALDVPTTGRLLEGWRYKLLDDVDSLHTGELVSLADVELVSPVTAPCRVLCQGANYRQHMVESGMDPSQKRYNMLFNKSSASISGPADPIVRPPHVRLLDYEVELGLVIGSPVRGSLGDDVDLASLVAGVVIANDVSARDVQIPQMQFFKGKSYRSFCPVGPVLCLLAPDELHQLAQLELSLWVNGERRQHDTTANLVFGPLETLSELSEVSDLDPGDLVLTGTPAGCAMRVPPPMITRLSGLLPDPVRFSLFTRMQERRGTYLQPGDLVEASVVSADGTLQLGTQRNRVVAS